MLNPLIPTLGGKNFAGDKETRGLTIRTSSSGAGGVGGGRRGGVMLFGAGAGACTGSGVGIRISGCGVGSFTTSGTTMAGSVNKECVNYNICTLTFRTLINNCLINCNASGNIVVVSIRTFCSFGIIQILTTTKK